MGLPCRGARLPVAYSSGLAGNCVWKSCVEIFTRWNPILLGCARTSRVRVRKSGCGLYLHFPASEGMWMGAWSEAHLGRVCLRARIPRPPFPIHHSIQSQKGEKP